MLPAGWSTSGWWEGEFAIKATLSVWVAYAVIDTAVILTAGVTTQLTTLVVVSFITKLAAVYSGAWFGAR